MTDADSRPDQGAPHVPEHPLFFFGTSRARMESIVRQNRLEYSGSGQGLINYFPIAVSCACEAAAIDVYFGNALRAGSCNNSLSQARLQIKKGANFEAAAAGLIAANRERDLLRLELQFSKEWRQLTAEAAYEMATSLQRRERELVEPVVMLFNGVLMGKLKYPFKYIGDEENWGPMFEVPAAIEPLNQFLLGTENISDSHIACWKERPVPHFFSSRAPDLLGDERVVAGGAPPRCRTTKGTARRRRS
jgi:hypothetical protein